MEVVVRCFARGSVLGDYGRLRLAERRKVRIDSLLWLQTAACGRMGGLRPLSQAAQENPLTIQAGEV